MTPGPYKIEPSNGGYWVVVDTRLNYRPVSYPTSRRICLAEVETMNRAYQEALAG